MSDLGKRLIASVRKFAAERPDYIYKNADNNYPWKVGCVYFTKDGNPSCLIGHALADFGLLNGQPDICGTSSINNVVKQYGWEIDSRELEWLVDVQMFQDSLKTWGQAVALADEADRL